MISYKGEIKREREKYSTFVGIQRGFGYLLDHDKKQEWREGKLSIDILRYKHDLMFLFYQN